MHEKSVEFGMNESSKKKLVRSGLTWAGHVARMGDEKPADSRCPEGGGEHEARKTEIATTDFIRSELERVGEA